ncbi:hypothetical protein [Rhodobacter capsulatus]|uniref:hypothetical protein n=1 Tax=Rhodobacter capsulatus TaxID=1061 RepID=UPI004027CEB0
MTFETPEFTQRKQQHIKKHRSLYWRTEPSPSIVMKTANNGFLDMSDSIIQFSMREFEYGYRAFVKGKGTVYHDGKEAGSLMTVYDFDTKQFCKKGAKPEGSPGTVTASNGAQIPSVWREYAQIRVFIDDNDYTLEIEDRDLFEVIVAMLKAHIDSDLIAAKFSGAMQQDNGYYKPEFEIIAAENIGGIPE